MVKFSKNGILEWIKNDLLVFAIFFVPFVNFAPVACGTVLLCLFFSAILGQREGINWRRLNVMSLLVFSFMLCTSVVSFFCLSDFHDFSRLQFQIRLPLFLFALAFLFRDFIGVSTRGMFASFALGAYGTALIVLLVFGYSLVKDFDNVPHSFMNVQYCFQCVVGMIGHRTYVGFNLLTALLITYYLFSSHWNRYKVILFLSLFAITGLFIFLSDARISFLSFLFLSFCLMMVEIKKFLKGWKGMLSIGILLALLFILLYQNDRVNNILLSLTDSSFSLKNADPRFNIWSCGWELFTTSPHPFWGYGSGTAKELLQEIYVKRSFSLALESHWEMHNQFLEILVENGVLGLLLFMGVLLAPLFLNSPVRKFYVIWVPMLCLNLFFESMMSRTIGTYPIALLIVVAGLTEKKMDYHPHPKWKQFCIASSLFAVLCVSVKYFQADKKSAYTAFQRFFERVDELPGNPPQALRGSYGLRIDNQVKSEIWHDWATMYYCFDRSSVDVSDSISFSLYAYVSEDFDADLLEIRAEERQRKAYESAYDMGRKGEWQLLSIHEVGLYGNIIYNVTCSKHGVKDFSSMRGYAIFANPEIRIIKKK